MTLAAGPELRKRPSAASRAGSGTNDSQESSQQRISSSIVGNMQRKRSNSQTAGASSQRRSSSSPLSSTRRRNSTAAGTSDSDLDDDEEHGSSSNAHDDDADQYKEESFSGPLHYLPLVVAVVPPIGAVLHGRAEAWTDFLILLLVAFYLYQIVRVPWEMYYASRTRRINAASVALSETEQEDLVPEAIKLRRKAARAELRQTELLSLLVCIISPFLGSYLLYWVRGALSDPDRFINPFNIKLFILASGVKPWAHFFKLVKNRSLFLQSEIAYPVPTVSILLDQVRDLRDEIAVLKANFATKSDMKTLRDGVDLPLTSLSKAVKRYERKEEYLRLSTEEKFEILHKRQEELLDELIISNHTVESLRADQERSSSLMRALRYIFSGESQGVQPGRGRVAVGFEDFNTQYAWYERGPLFYVFLPLIASNRVMDATGRLFDSLRKQIGPLERGGMLEDTASAHHSTSRPPSAARLR